MKPTRRQSRFFNDTLHPPTNVRVVDPDGVEHPVQVVYDETDRVGTQIFRVVDLPPSTTVARIKIQTLPAMTSVAMPLEDKL